MSTEAFRSAAFGAIDAYMNANHPGVFVMYENGPEVDEESVGDIFVEVSLRFYGAALSEVGPNSRSRHMGAISVDVYAKQATGTAAAGAIVSGVMQLLRSKRLGPGLTRAPQRTVPNSLKGWYVTGTLVPFTVDEI